MNPKSAELFELLSSRSPAVAYDLVSPFADFLVLARETCGGDLDMALIMITITLRSSCHPDFRSLDPADTGTGHLMPGYGTNGRSLAESTGIPRESVRRKVKQLIAAGWVARHGAHLRYTVRGYHAVAPAREAMLRLYVRGVQVIEALQAGSPPAAVQPLRAPGLD